MISFARVSKQYGRQIRFVAASFQLNRTARIGAAARVVHSGCRKAFGQFFMIAPAAQGNEGGPITVPSGFDAQRIRLTGRCEWTTAVQGYAETSRMDCR